MVFNKSKRGQAAIEFLMTYGWMLLVVLIVGALIFSFVDFGSLLPNRLDLTGNLRADSSQIISYDTGEIILIATYVGAKASSIDPESIKFEADLGFTCDNTAPNTVSVTNIDTGSNETSDGTAGDSVNFINGQLAMIKFNCQDESESFIIGDVMEGQVTIPVKNTRTNLAIDSRGRLRVGVSEG